MATATKINIRRVAHKICDCGMFYTKTGFESIKPDYVELNGTSYAERLCTSCKAPFGTLVRRGPVDDVD